MMRDFRLNSPAPKTPVSRPGLIASVLVAAALLAPPALAHQTFLQPDSFVSAAGEQVNIALTSALAYPDIEFGPARDRIALVEVSVGNQGVETLSFEENETFLNISFTTEHTGFAVASTSSKPRAGQIEAKDTSMYLDEIGASEAIRAAFDALPGEPPLDRSYAKHSKTFFCVETCTGGREASLAPIGQPLEFIGIGGINDTFALMRNGEPVANHSVTVVSPGSDNQELTTSEDGSVHLDAPLRGAVLLSAVWITVPDQADGVYHSDYATLTVDLSGAR